MGKGSMDLWRVGGTRPTPLSANQRDYTLRGAVFSHDGRNVATISSDNDVRIWSADGKSAPLVLRGHLLEVKSLAWSADDSLLVSGSLDLTARVWNTHRLVEPIVLRAEGPVSNVAFTRDGSRVVTRTATTNAVRVWQLHPDSLQAHLRASTTACLSIEFRQSFLGEPEH